MLGNKAVNTYGKAGPGADLKIFMEKRLLITLNARRKIVGQLRGYDTFMNLTVDNAFEILKDEKQRKLGTVVIRGNSVLSWECIDKVETRHC